jgi:hypothetical protein
VAKAAEDVQVLQKFIELCELYNDRDKALTDLPYLISHMEVIDQNTGDRFNFKHVAEPLKPGEIEVVGNKLVPRDKTWRWQRYVIDRLLDRNRVIFLKGQADRCHLDRPRRRRCGGDPEARHRLPDLPATTRRGGRQRSPLVAAVRVAAEALHRAHQGHQARPGGTAWDGRGGVAVHRTARQTHLARSCRCRARRPRGMGAPSGM